MKLKTKGFGPVFKKTIKAWLDKDPFRQSAVIAYYAIFSLPALLVLIINVAGFFFGREAVNGEISRQIAGVMGDQTASAVEGFVAKAGETKAGVISTIIAVVTLVLGATGVFVQLQKSLNFIWDVQQKPDQGLLVAVRQRLFSFGLILTIGFLLLVSLVVSSLLAAFSHYLEGAFPDVVAYLFYALEMAVSLVIISTLFLLMFRYLPDVRTPWRYLFTGSLITGLLFMVGKYGLSFYFGKADPASAYGAAGSVVLILLWVSYSSMIVFFGAEFTKQFAVYHGAHTEPIAIAEKVDDGCKTGDASSARTGRDRVKKEKSHHAEKKRTMNKETRHGRIRTLEHLDDEITRLEGRSQVHLIAVKQKLKPARVVRDILKKKIVLPRPENPELAMEGLDFAIQFLVDRVALKNAGPTVRTLSVYVLREIAKNYAYGRRASLKEQIGEWLNLPGRRKREESEFRPMEDPVDEYYGNL